MRSKSHFIKSLLVAGLLIFFNCNALWAQNETTQETTVKKITLLYNSEKQIGDKELTTVSQFTRKLINIFPVVEKIKLVKWQNENSFYKKTEQEIFDSMRVDAFYQLNFSLKLDSISSVTPTFVVRNMNNGSFDKITLPVYSADYYKNYNYAQFIADELSGFVNSYFNINNGNKKVFSPESYKWDKLFPMANASSSAGDYSRSNFLLYLLIEKNPSLPDTAKVRAYNLLGSNKLNQYRIDEAEEEFNKVLALDARNYWAGIGITKVRIEQGDFGHALWKADAIVPVSSEVFLLKGQAYLGMDSLDKAVEYFKKISSKSNTDLYNKKLLFLGTIYLKADETDKAYDIYKELYLMDTTDSNVGYLYGYLIGLKGFDEFKNKNYNKAAEFLLAANKVYQSTDVTDYLRLAFIYERRFDEALELIDQKIKSGEYSTDNIYLTHALDIRKVFIDTTQTEFKNINEFGEQILRALELHIKFNPDDPLGYFYKGNTLTRMGRGTEGLSQMEIAYQKNTQDRSIQLDLMELYLLNNKLDECEDFYKSVIQNYKANKIKANDRDQALMNYLLITSLKLQNKDIKKPQKKLDKLFKSGVVVDRWSYDSYLSWLEKSNYDVAAKSFLVDLTNEMKSHNKPG